MVPFLWRIFNFELEEKLDHRSDVKFHGDSDGNGLKVQKLKINTLITLIGLNYPKYGNFQFWELEEKVNHQYNTEFYGDSDGNILEGWKRTLDSSIVLWLS